VQEPIGVHVLQRARGRQLLDWQAFLQVDLNPKP
jgi:hypothetical protein